MLGREERERGRDRGLSDPAFTRDEHKAPVEQSRRVRARWLSRDGPQGPAASVGSEAHPAVGLGGPDLHVRDAVRLELQPAALADP